MVRVDLSKLTLEQRLEGSEGASQMNILKKSVLEGENPDKGPEAGTCHVNTGNSEEVSETGVSLA